MRLGVSSRAALLLLLGSLPGSYFNIPIWHLPAETVFAGGEIDFFGMRYMAPVVVQWPGTIVAVNIGGAIIPGVMSLYLLATHRLWLKGDVGFTAVAAICNLLRDCVHWN